MSSQNSTSGGSFIAVTLFFSQLSLEMFHCGCAEGISFHREFLVERRTLMIRKNEQEHNETLVPRAQYRRLDFGRNLPSIYDGQSSVLRGTSSHCAAAVRSLKARTSIIASDISNSYECATPEVIGLSANSADFAGCFTLRRRRAVWIM